MEFPIWGAGGGDFKITTNAKACGTQFDPKDHAHRFNVSQKKLQPDSLSKAQFSFHFSQQTTPLQLN
jgi:hypothetical protein